MKVGLSLCLFSFVSLLGWRPSAGSKKLPLGHCSVSVDIQKLRDEFSGIKALIQSEDESMNIRILKRSESLQVTEPADRCCFLRHLFRLYLDRVFNHYKTHDSDILRKISTIANTFLGVKRDLRLCHDHSTCHCGEEARGKFSRVLSHFEKLDAEAAAVKALGELDILLSWMEDIEQPE
ncbi:interleukin-20 [Ornithorhynchus anatinus]|uniref:Interleukin family protein n=1 Tax=Ornithorhynchus anatinus TaxID=9258 RepID=F7AQ09_ORNAN|nr:interleukin-20 [Ornithorhynchus anatinus]